MIDPFMKEIQDVFLVESSELLEKTEQIFLALEKPGDHREDFSQLKRLAHNLKGSGRAVGFDSLANFCHKIENLVIALDEGKLELAEMAIQLLLVCNDRLKLDIDILKQNSETELNYNELFLSIDDLLSGQPAELKEEVDPNQLSDLISYQLQNALTESEAPAMTVAAADPLKKEQGTPPPLSKEPADEYIRIPMKRIDELLDSFGEQVIFLSALDHYKNNFELHKEDLVRTILNLKKLAYDLQQSTLTLRMVNLKTLFSKLERAIRDASKTTGKKVDCVFIGAEQELDKIMVDQLSDPLTHMVRNAVDHGLESPEGRASAGKSATGNVMIIARREGGAFTLEIRDDGKGLDPEVIRAKGISKGLISKNDDLPVEKIYDLIFENGFSTKENVSEISGRGVGMNVVKEMILGLKGSYEIESKIGHGTSFKIKLPLSLSLFNAITIQVKDQNYLVPSSQILEIINMADVGMREIDSEHKVVQIRDQIIDLVDLSSAINSGKSQKIAHQPQMILISEFQNRKVGFLVNKVMGIQRIVQKPLSPEVTICKGAVGVTILGDGSPTIILDLKVLHQAIPAKKSIHVQRARAA